MALVELRTTCPLCKQHELELTIRTYERQEPHEELRSDFDGVENVMPLGLRVCERTHNWLWSDMAFKEFFTSEELSKFDDLAKVELELLRKCR